jgi:hypothetical protein
MPLSFQDAEFFPVPLLTLSLNFEVFILGVYSAVFVVLSFDLVGN